MPQNKTHRRQVFYETPPVPQNGAQINLFTIPVAKPHDNCVCAPAAILAYERGVGVLCSDMPWRCPFSQQPETPVE